MGETQRMASRRTDRLTPTQDYRFERRFSFAMFGLWLVLCSGLIVAVPPLGVVLLALGVWKLASRLRAAKEVRDGRVRLYNTFAGKLDKLCRARGTDPADA